MMRSLILLPVVIALGCSSGGYGSSPSVAALDQSLELSTVIAIDEAVSDGPGFLVIREADAAGAPAAGIGRIGLPDGASADLTVALRRPVQDGETLFATLHVDRGEIGVYEFPGPDEPATDDAGAAIAVPFVATVSAGTPAVRIELGNVGSDAFLVARVEPASFGAQVGGEGENPDLTLRAGWRYEIVNPVTDIHPFELTTTGDEPSRDVVLLSQSDDGAMEADGSILWLEDGERMLFTTSETMAGATDGYRCNHHAFTMRGAILFASE
jgi:hypothetical protein